MVSLDNLSRCPHIRQRKNTLVALNPPASARVCVGKVRHIFGIRYALNILHSVFFLVSVAEAYNIIHRIVVGADSFLREYKYRKTPKQTRAHSQQNKHIEHGIIISLHATRQFSITIRVSRWTAQQQNKLNFIHDRVIYRL